MKLIHISDLHLGKRIYELSLIEDQKYILQEIIKIIEKEQPEGVIIAGDVYDKSIPPTEAVTLFDEFLVSISKLNKNVFIISGNHDSTERIAFGGRLMLKSGIYFSPVFNGKIEPIVINDEFGKVNIWMLPFVKPANVRPYFEDTEINSYNDAIKTVVGSLKINKEERNIMITHQFITGSKRTESEEISVGGTDNIDVAIFDDFDYTALGHIHSPQNCNGEKVRYSGTPLKYSFSEAKDNKSVTIIELNEKNNMKLRIAPLIPLHDMVEIKGTYDEITLKSYYENTTLQSDYLHITLTDEHDIMDAISKLRSIYHNILKLDYDNLRTRRNNVIDIDKTENKSPEEYFDDFFEKQNNQKMSETQRKFIEELIEMIWEGEK